MDGKNTNNNNNTFKKRKVLNGGFSEVAGVNQVKGYVKREREEEAGKNKSNMMKLTMKMIVIRGSGLIRSKSKERA